MTQGERLIKAAKEAVEFTRGEAPAGRITTFIGGPYTKGGRRTLIQYKVNDVYIVWNYDLGIWNKVNEPVKLIIEKE